MKRRHFLALLIGLLALPLVSARQGSPAGDTPPVSGKPVTLVADGISVSEALKSLRAQTGIGVDDRRGQGKEAKIVLNLKKATFWQALDAVAERSRSVLSLYQADGVIALVDGPPPAVEPS